MAQLPIGQFLTERLTEFDSTFELRSGTGFESLFFEPLELIVQPFRDEANDIETGQSFQLILLTSDPDAFDPSAVDALASNIFVYRITGGYGGGVARAYYNDPVDREYPATGASFSDSNGNTYSNPAPFAITAAQMSTQIDVNGLYYFDIPVQADVIGLAGNIIRDSLVALANDTDVVSVTNQLAFKGGLNTETNTQLITRAQNSIGVRDLLIGNGFNAILFQNFASFLVALQPIGFGDIEMMRDIVYNTHIGGKVDGYCYVGPLQQGSAQFTGLLLDTTRQTYASINITLAGVTPTSVGNPDIDRSNGLPPIVQEIKISIAATYTSPVSLSTYPLASNQYVQIGINGRFLNVRIAGVNPAATAPNEIINLINAAFGINVAFAVGNSIKITSPTAGLTSQVVLATPTVGTSALFPVFGLLDVGSPYTYDGTGPVTYLEGVDYSVNDLNGTIQRILGPTVLTFQTTGVTTHNSDVFTDPTSNIFLNVLEGDIVSISSGGDVGDYRVVSKTNNNTLVLDEELTTNASGIDYQITRTGIKSGQEVYVQYYYNPLSIDIGNMVVLDTLGRVRGIRPGRTNQTITDLAFLRITSIEVIDPLTLAPTGQVLNGEGGYGSGGYGQGGYGRGNGSDYFLVVNIPTARFSMYEDSYIVVGSQYQGLSFQVNYEFAPQVSELHNFVIAPNNRVLDGDILMKHFLPAYVSGTITYSVSSTNAPILTPAQLTALVIAKINSLTPGQNLTYTDINQVIIRNLDPFDQYDVYIQAFTLTAVIHNTDGTITGVTGVDQLVVPTLNPFPSDTPHPLTPRITHWIADQIVLVQA